MERFGGDEPVAKLSDEQKVALAEVDEKFNARKAEKELFLDEQLKKAAESGRATFFNVEPGDYTLSFSHPDMDCGNTIPVKVVAGYNMAWAGVLCLPLE